MFHKITGLSLLLFLVSVIHAQSNATISGIVRKQDSGALFAGAKVELIRVDGSAPQIYSATTLSNGTFALMNIRPGDYRLAASGNGYLRTELGQRLANKSGTVLTLSAGQSTANLEIRVAAAGAISGRVMDSSGEPIGAAQIRALTTSYKDGRRILKVALSTYTNDLGEYRLFGLPPGNYYVSALRTEGGAAFQELDMSLLIQSDNHSFAYKNVPFYYPGTTSPEAASVISLISGDNLKGVDISVTPTGPYQIHGRVPGGQANVKLVSINGMAASLTPVRQASATAANFSFDGVAPGTYLLIAHSGMSWGSTRIDVSNSNLENVTIPLDSVIIVPAHASFDDRVPLESDPDFTAVHFHLRTYPPIEGIESDQYNPFANGSFGFEVIRGEDYRITLETLPSEKPALRDAYIRSIRMGSRDVLNDGLEFNGESDARIEIVIGTKPGEIAGTVLNDKRLPNANSTVVLVPDGSARKRSEAYFIAMSDLAGRFQLRDVPPGTYTLFAWEDIEADAWEDPQIIRQYEPSGTRITVFEGKNAPLTISVIPAS